MAKTLTGTKKESGNQPSFVFGKINFILMIAGIIVIACGFLLMVGGGSKDPTVFNEAELYSPMRIKVAPVVILIGLIIEIFAIMVKAKD